MEKKPENDSGMFGKHGPLAKVFDAIENWHKYNPLSRIYHMVNEFYGLGKEYLTLLNPKAESPWKEKLFIWLVVAGMFGGILASIFLIEGWIALPVAIGIIIIGGIIMTKVNKHYCVIDPLTIQAWQAFAWYCIQAERKGYWEYGGQRYQSWIYYRYDEGKKQRLLMDFQRFKVDFEKQKKAGLEKESWLSRLLEKIL